MQYFRIFSESFDGELLTLEAYKVLKSHLTKFESYPVKANEVEADDSIYDVEDLAELGYYTDSDDYVVQSDDDLIDILDNGVNDWDD